MYSLIITYCIQGFMCFVEPVDASFVSLERCFIVGAILSGGLKTDFDFRSELVYQLQCTGLNEVPVIVNF